MRYLLAGAGLAALYGGAYWLLVSGIGSAPLTANLLAWLLALVAGYAVHSRWSFRGHEGEGGVGARLRYLAVNMLGFLINSLWVWMLVDLLGAPRLWPLVPILVVTPFLCFMANRRFVFPASRRIR